MPNFIQVCANKALSKSARTLAKIMGLGILGSKGKDGLYGSRVINWGSSTQHPFVHYLNPPIKIAAAKDKLASLQLFKFNDVTTVQYTQEKAEALKWLAEGKSILARKLLNASGGKGIRFYSGGEGVVDIVDAPLYTVYQPKTREYRVHIFLGEVLDVQEKRKRKGVDSVDMRIRSHRRGWVFCRQNVERPEALLALAKSAYKCLGVDFAAFDIIWSKKEDRYYVLEANTAPGIDGTSLELYNKAIQGWLNQKQQEDYNENPTTLLQAISV